MTWVRIVPTRSLGIGSLCGSYDYLMTGWLIGLFQLQIINLKLDCIDRFLLSLVYQSWDNKEII